MGLLSRLKNMFNKNIDCSKDLDGVFFHLLPMSKPINVNSNIIVKEGFVAVFVCKNKVTDILPAGKHRLDNSTIPYTFKRLKLYKINKHGNMPKKFKCDIYFISKNKIENFEFTSDQPYLKKSNQFGRVVAYGEGVCNFTITQPEKLLEYLLLEYAYIKDKKAKDKISVIIGNAVNEILEDSRLAFENILLDVENVYLHINTNIEKELEFCGIKCDNVKLTCMQVSSKIQDKVDEYIKIQNEYKKQFANQSQLTFKEAYSRFEMSENASISMRNEGDLKGGSEPEITKKQCLYCRNYINYNAKYCEFCGFNQNMDEN